MSAVSTARRRRHTRYGEDLDGRRRKENETNLDDGETGNSLLISKQSLNLCVTFELCHMV